MNNDLISRSELIKALNEAQVEFDEYYKGLGKAKVITDNAPTVEPKQGEWFEYIDKGILKARHGDYVLYKVDFLLDNLAREVNIMEGARRMKGGADNDVR